MTLNAFSKSKVYGNGLRWTEQVMDTFVDDLSTWLNTEVVGKTPDKSASTTITGTWTFTPLTTFTAGIKSGNSTIQRADGDVWTMPDYGAQNFVGDSSTQTLTNKSLTSPTLTGTVVIPAADPPGAASALTKESIVKGWAFVSISGGTVTLTNSYNVSSLTDGGAGITTVVWNTDFANANYAVTISPEDPNGTDPFICSWRNKTAGSVDVYTRLKSTGALTDNINFCIIAIGDQ